MEMVAFYSLFTIGVVFAILGLSDKSPIGGDLTNRLKEPPPWPLWQILLPSTLVTLIVSGLLIWLTQFWDKRRQDELADCKKELDKKSTQLENLHAIFKERERMRRLDHITGIPNHIAWMDDLKQWDAENEKDLCLILIDIDNFRWLNSRSPECADKVLRYFAQNTYSSMRRDEQIYKANAEMYRHYQGGDEFFFIISGNAYNGIGFINRLADRVRSYQSDIRKTLLREHLKEEDVDSFRLSFCGVILPHSEPETALKSAYDVLARAKGSKETRLLIVFGRHYYEEPKSLREQLQTLKETNRVRIKALDDESRNRYAESKAMQRDLLDYERELVANIAARQRDLLDHERELDSNIAILLKAEQTFAVPKPAQDKTDQ
jgi:diguanylate cyclase (GGDEF)-like protein